jgi:hypothetical protein
MCTFRYNSASRPFNSLPLSVITLERFTTSAFVDIRVPKKNVEEGLAVCSVGLHFQPLVVIVGSSVALGMYAPNDEGWTFMLKSELEKRGYDVYNHAVSGYNARYTPYKERSSKIRDTLKDFSNTVIPFSPDIVIVGLSLANEGFYL